MSMLKVSDVSVRLGGQDIIKNLSFEVDSGDWLMLVGPNGAGKTTAVRAVSQAVGYRGSVSFEGSGLKKIKPNERAKLLGILSQSYAASFPLTAGEIVRLGRYAYCPRAFDTLSDEDEEKIAEAVQMTGIEPFLNRSVATLSGGERQRVFLAQVFAQNPRILILDEPANHLDLIYQKQVFELVEKWLQTPGRAVISVVHDLSLARAFGTKALLLNGGETVAQGEPREVLSDDNLTRVYQMDVAAWLRGLLGQWT